MNSFNPPGVYIVRFDANGKVIAPPPPQPGQPITFPTMLTPIPEDYVPPPGSRPTPPKKIQMGGHHGPMWKGPMPPGFWSNNPDQEWKEEMERRKLQEDWYKNHVQQSSFNIVRRGNLPSIPVIPLPQPGQQRPIPPPLPQPRPQTSPYGPPRITPRPANRNDDFIPPPPPPLVMNRANISREIFRQGYDLITHDNTPGVKPTIKIPSDSDDESRFLK